MSGVVTVERGDAPLIVSFPHGGTDLCDVEQAFVSPWLARHDTDWWIAELFAFVRDYGATTVATSVSRSVIDVNRDPSGASLYPGLATTGLCPLTTFDGAALYVAGEPDQAEIDRRRTIYFTPYHRALTEELLRLRKMHSRVVLFDAHSIRSRIPRLFEGVLPQFNLGTNGGSSCDPLFENSLGSICSLSGHSWVVNGRFKGGWTTRHYGKPDQGIHAVQMELSQRGYLDEPERTSVMNWPGPIDRQAPIVPTLRALIEACLAFAEGSKP